MCWVPNQLVLLCPGLKCTDTDICLEDKVSLFLDQCSVAMCVHIIQTSFLTVVCSNWTQRGTFSNQVQIYWMMLQYPPALSSVGLSLMEWPTQHTVKRGYVPRLDLTCVMCKCNLEYLFSRFHLVLMSSVMSPVAVEELYDVCRSHIGVISVWACTL